MSETSNPQPGSSAPSPGSLTPEACWEYLKVVIDPEIYQNIVDLGLVYDIEVDPEQAVIVKMTLTTPHCPMGPQIIADVEKTLLSKGARTVDVRIVWEPMWTPSAMTEALQRELGIIPDPAEDNTEEEEPVLEIDPPPPPPAKKKGLLGRLFGS